MSGPASTNSGQTIKISINIAPETLGELLPCYLHAGLDGGLQEPALRPTFNLPNHRVPGASQQAPKAIITSSSGLGAVDDQAVDHRFIDFDWRDTVSRTKADQGGEFCLREA